MKVSHSLVPVFDDPNLTSLGGLPAVMVLAERAGLHGLAGEHVKVPGHAGANWCASEFPDSRFVVLTLLIVLLGVLRGPVWGSCRRAPNAYASYCTGARSNAQCLDTRVSW